MAKKTGEIRVKKQGAKSYRNLKKTIEKKRGKEILGIKWHSDRSAPPVHDPIRAGQKTSWP